MRRRFATCAWRHCGCTLEAFGADYEACRAWPDEEWRERVERGVGGEHGITLVAEEPGGALVGMTGIFRDDGRRRGTSARSGASTSGKRGGGGASPMPCSAAASNGRGRTACAPRDSPW
jgi:hypothetical protein